MWINFKRATTNEDRAMSLRPIMKFVCLTHSLTQRQMHSSGCAHCPAKHVVLKSHQAFTFCFYVEQNKKLYKQNSDSSHLSLFLVARLQDGMSSALPWRSVQSDAALLAVQPWRPTEVLWAATRPRRNQKEVMTSSYTSTPSRSDDIITHLNPIKKKWWQSKTQKKKKVLIRGVSHLCGGGRGQQVGVSSRKQIYFNTRH